MKFPAILFSLGALLLIAFSPSLQLPVFSTSPNDGVVEVCNDAGLRSAAAGGGTITFACSGTIILTQGSVGLIDGTVLDGSGQDVTISGDNSFKVFLASGNVTVKNLTIEGGRGGSYTTGGGINSTGSLTVINTTFYNNFSARGGAIATYGDLSVIDSTFRNNGAFGNNGGSGGVIYNDLGATASIENSTFYSNSSNGGGVIDNYGELTISNSTFHANSATSEGGAISNSGDLTITNSTFSANTGGNYTTSGGTIKSRDEGTVTLKNTIVAYSPAQSSNCAGSFIDGGGNISYPDSTCPGMNEDPLLGSLQDNGGPTKTTALGEGSAAIDAADDSICAAPPVNNLDQRGVSRPQGASCDIGAFEAEGTSPASQQLWLPVVTR